MSQTKENIIYPVNSRRATYLDMVDNYCDKTKDLSSGYMTKYKAAVNSSTYGMDASAFSFVNMSNDIVTMSPSQVYDVNENYIEHVAHSVCVSTAMNGHIDATLPDLMVYKDLTVDEEMSLHDFIYGCAFDVDHEAIGRTQTTPVFKTLLLQIASKTYVSYRCSYLTFRWATFADEEDTCSDKQMCNSLNFRYNYTPDNWKCSDFFINNYLWEPAVSATSAKSIVPAKTYAEHLIDKPSETKSYIDYTRQQYAPNYIVFNIESYITDTFVPIKALTVSLVSYEILSNGKFYEESDSFRRVGTKLIQSYNYNYLLYLTYPIRGEFPNIYKYTFKIEQYANSTDFKYDTVSIFVAPPYYIITMEFKCASWAIPMRMGMFNKVLGKETKCIIGFNKAQSKNEDYLINEQYNPIYTKTDSYDEYPNKTSTFFRDQHIFKDDEQYAVFPKFIIDAEEKHLPISLLSLRKDDSLYQWMVDDQSAYKSSSGRYYYNMLGWQHQKNPEKYQYNPTYESVVFTMSTDEAINASADDKDSVYIEGNTYYYTFNIYALESVTDIHLFASYMYMPNNAWSSTTDSMGYNRLAVHIRKITQCGLSQHCDSSSFGVAKDNHLQIDIVNVEDPNKNATQVYPVTREYDGTGDTYTRCYTVNGDPYNGAAVEVPESYGLYKLKLKEAYQNTWVGFSDFLYGWGAHTSSYPSALNEWDRRQIDLIGDRMSRYFFLSGDSDKDWGTGKNGTAGSGYNRNVIASGYTDVNFNLVYPMEYALLAWNVFGATDTREDNVESYYKRRLSHPLVYALDSQKGYDDYVTNWYFSRVLRNETTVDTTDCYTSAPPYPQTLNVDATTFGFQVTKSTLLKFGRRFMTARRLSLEKNSIWTYGDLSDD